MSVTLVSEFFFCACIRLKKCKKTNKIMINNKLPMPECVYEVGVKNNIIELFRSFVTRTTIKINIGRTD
jgi:hypothetical protein